MRLSAARRWCRAMVCTTQAAAAPSPRARAVAGQATAVQVNSSPVSGRQTGVRPTVSVPAARVASAEHASISAVRMASAGFAARPMTTRNTARMRSDAAQWNPKAIQAATMAAHMADAAAHRVSVNGIEGVVGRAGLVPDGHDAVRGRPWWRGRRQSPGRSLGRLGMGCQTAFDRQAGAIRFQPGVKKGFILHGGRIDAADVPVGFDRRQGLVTQREGMFEHRAVGLHTELFPGDVEPVPKHIVHRHGEEFHGVLGRVVPFHRDDTTPVPPGRSTTPSTTGTAWRMCFGVDGWPAAGAPARSKHGNAMSEGVHTTDVAIIGAGPVGLFAVFECGMLRMRCHVLDALEAVGGQCQALYPEKPIYDIPAHPAISGAGLIEALEAQAAPFRPVYHLGHAVTGLTRRDDGRFLLETAGGVQVDARAVIIAAGVGAFGPNRPPLDGLADYEGRSVFYLVRRRDDFAGKRLVIAGGGDSAVDWALSLADVAAHVMVVHRRPKFRAAPESVARMQALAAEGKLELVVPYQLAGLEGRDGQLTGVRVATLEGEERLLEADVLLPFFGLAANLGPIADWGLNLERNLIPIDPATAGTDTPGLFAVGDIATYPRKLKLILTGFAEVAQAAHAIHPLVFPGEALHFEYSTTKGVPGQA